VAPTIPTGVPGTLAAGVTWKWTTSPGLYPPSEGWALSYALRGAGALDISGAQVTNDGAATFTITVAADATAALAAGAYRWVAYAEKAGEKYEVAKGVVDVTANLATAAAGALQSQAEAMVTRLDAEIRARIAGTGSGHNSITIGSRAIEKIPLEQLYELRNKYQQQANRERSKGRFAPVKLRFTRAR
jgi:hypothetical protein